MGTAVECAVRLDTMADDLTATVIADWRQLVNGTLKTVEHMALDSGDSREGQVIVIPTYFTRCHGPSPCTRIHSLSATFLVARRRNRATPLARCASIARAAAGRLIAMRNAMVFPLLRGETASAISTLVMLLLV